MKNEGSEKSVKSSKLLMISLTILTIANFVALAAISVFMYSTYADIKRNSTSIALAKTHIHKLDSNISKLSLKIDESLKTPPPEQENEKPEPDKIEGPKPEEKEEDDFDLQLEDDGLGFEDKTPEKHNYPEGYGVKRLKTKEDIDQKLLLALYWLRDHQDPKLGCWFSDNFEEQCKTTATLPFSPRFKRNGVCANVNGKSDKGYKEMTNAVTALALLAFQGAGYTFREGEFKLTVKKALRYLASIQMDKGIFGTESDKYSMLSHVLCTQAMAEAYAMTASAKLKLPAQMGVDYIAKKQIENPDEGWLGWALDESSVQTDTFVTSLTAFALWSAHYASLRVPNRCWDGVNKVLTDMTLIPKNGRNGDKKYPRTGYAKKGDATIKIGNVTSKMPTMDALNILMKRIMRTKSTDSNLMSQADFIVKNENIPSAEEPLKIEFLYWNLASLAMFQMGDNYWNLWKKQAYDSIIKLQRLEDENACAYGSWDPIDTWGSAGGRVFATAINALTLETEYRYKFMN